MNHQSILAALLCTAALLTGCGAGAGSPAHPSGSGQDTEGVGQPLSELERLAAKTAAWEAAGTYEDEGAYREVLLRVLELARAADNGTYRCQDPSQLSEDKLEALTDAALRCNYSYAQFTESGPFSRENLHAAIGMLMIYTPGTLEAPIFGNLDGENPAIPEGNYCYVKKDDILPFLERTLVPAAQAYREYQEDFPEEWNWHETEDGSVYVDVFGLTAALPGGMPYVTGIEPLGGDRYLVRCDMQGPGGIHYLLAMVVEDNAQSGEVPHAVVLDCVSGSVWSNGEPLPQEEVDALREQYWVPGEGGREAVDLLNRLEALSPVPYHTELVEQMSPAMEQALMDAKVTSELLSDDTFEAYIHALQLQPAMHRYSEADAWLPSDPEYTIPYGDEWNLYPAEELEEAFQRRFNFDLAANGRAWLNDPDFVPVGAYTDGPMATYDGENYDIYTRGIGYVGFPQAVSLICDYDGTYTAVFTDLEFLGVSMIRVRNIGSGEEPFFQLLGYELPG